jgi:hypothetical protein
VTVHFINLIECTVTVTLWTATEREKGQPPDIARRVDPRQRHIGPSALNKRAVPATSVASARVIGMAVPGVEFRQDGKNEGQKQYVSRPISDFEEKWVVATRRPD